MWINLKVKWDKNKEGTKKEYKDQFLKKATRLFTKYLKFVFSGIRTSSHLLIQKLLSTKE